MWRGMCDWRSDALRELKALSLDEYTFHCGVHTKMMFGVSPIWHTQCLEYRRLCSSAPANDRLYSLCLPVYWLCEVLFFDRLLPWCQRPSWKSRHNSGLLASLSLRNKSLALALLLFVSICLLYSGGHIWVTILLRGCTEPFLSLPQMPQIKLSEIKHASKRMMLFCLNQQTK